MQASQNKDETSTNTQMDELQWDREKLPTFEKVYLKKNFDLFQWQKIF